MRAAAIGRAGTITIVSACLVAAACSATATDEVAAPTTTTAESTTTTLEPADPPTTSTTSMATTTTIVDELEGPVDDLLVSLGADRIAAFGGVACAEEVILLLVAIDRYEADTGRKADDFADVEAALGGPLERWTWDGGSTDPTPRSGSGCSSAGFDSPTEDATSVCSVERRTIETAVEAFRAMNPTADAPTEDELVGGFLQQPSDRWDLDGWSVVPAPGSICDLR